MAFTQTQSNESVNAGADAKCALANGGFLDWYEGTQPASADSSIGSSLLLASLQFGTPAFANAVAGAAQANTIIPEASAPASGFAQWFRVWKADHVSPLWDGSIGTSGCNLNTIDPNIKIGQTVPCSVFIYIDDKS
jgi:hypothetical protein